MGTVRGCGRPLPLAGQWERGLRGHSASFHRSPGQSCGSSSAKGGLQAPAALGELGTLPLQSRENETKSHSCFLSPSGFCHLAPVAGAVPGSLQRSRVNDAPAFWAETTKRSPRRLAERGAQESRPMKLLTDWRAHLPAARRWSALSSLPKTLGRGPTARPLLGPPEQHPRHRADVHCAAPRTLGRRKRHRNRDPEKLPGTRGPSPAESSTRSRKNVGMCRRTRMRPRVSGNVQGVQDTKSPRTGRTRNVPARVGRDGRRHLHPGPGEAGADSAAAAVKQQQ